MASITRCGTCVPPGPSRNAAGCPFTVCEREGNCARTHWTSSAAVTAFSVVGIGVIIFITEMVTVTPSLPAPSPPASRTLSRTTRDSPPSLPVREKYPSRNIHTKTSPQHRPLGRSSPPVPAARLPLSHPPPAAPGTPACKDALPSAPPVPRRRSTHESPRVQFCSAEPEHPSAP